MEYSEILKNIDKKLSTKKTSFQKIFSIVNYINQLNLDDNKIYELVGDLVLTGRLDSLLEKFVSDKTINLDKISELYNNSILDLALGLYCGEKKYEIISNENLTYFDDDQILTSEKQYIKEISKFELLTKDEEQALFIQYKENNDLKAKERLINCNLKLVVNIANRYVTNNLTSLDLIGEGNIGLIKAIEKFDYKKNYKLSTYATWWIRQSISLAVVNLDKKVRISKDINEKSNKLKNFRHTYEKSFNCRPSLDECIKKTGLTKDQIELIDTMPKMMISLNQPVLAQNEDKDNNEIMDFVCSDENVQNDVEEKIINESVDSILIEAKLSKNQRYIIYKRFGLDGEDPKTLNEIGIELGITRERVRQIETKTLKKLSNNKKLRELKKKY